MSVDEMHARLLQIEAFFGAKKSSLPTRRWLAVLRSPTGACAIISDDSLDALQERAGMSAAHWWRTMVFVNLETGKMWRPVVKPSLGTPVATLGEISNVRTSFAGADRDLQA